MDDITAISNAVGYSIILQNHLKESREYQNKLIINTLLPLMVISLLEIEMIFKAKLETEGKKYDKNKEGHNIAKLFNLLPEKTKNIITDNYDKLTKNIPRNKGCELLSFNDLIKLHDDDLFTKLRYLDEPCVKSIKISFIDSTTYLRYTLENIFQLPPVEMIGNLDYKPTEEILKKDVVYGKSVFKNI